MRYRIKTLLIVVAISSLVALAFRSYLDRITYHITGEIAVDWTQVPGNVAEDATAIRLPRAVGRTFYGGKRITAWPSKEAIFFEASAKPGDYERVRSELTSAMIEFAKSNPELNPGHASVHVFRDGPGGGAVFVD